MTDSAELLEAVQEIRSLLRLMAEPAIAERDRKLRDELMRVALKAPKKQRAIMLMDGTKKQSDIRRESGMDDGNLSRLVKELVNANLLTGDVKQPKLSITLPSNFFERGASND